MDIIKLTHENLLNEHICCAISNNNDIQVKSKKEWLSKALDDGLVFLKCDVRGKCFIEYIPAEKAWAPVEADGYMYINCLWVSGQFKGQGYSNLLLEECIKDSKQKCKKGLVTLSSKKKLGFLSDKKYMTYKGFRVCDTADPYFELMYLPFDEPNDKPRFKDCVKEHKRDDSGFTLYYTNQCPFTAKYVPLIEDIAKQRGLQFKSIHLDSAAGAQNAPSPFTTYSLFYNGELVTHEILSEKKFLQIIEAKDLN